MLVNSSALDPPSCVTCFTAPHEKSAPEQAQGSLNHEPPGKDDHVTCRETSRGTPLRPFTGRARARDDGLIADAQDGALTPRNSP